MTNDTGLITLVQQARFFFNHPAGIDIYIARVGSRRAGYLLLRQTANTVFITEAVDQPFRRNGLAISMVRFAQALHANLTAEILSTNTASIGLHLHAGFTYAGQHDDLQSFRFTRPA